MLSTKVDDPRLLSVTITQVKVTPDTKRADVYYTMLGDKEMRQSTHKGLESAAGWLRREIGSRTRLRNTPALIFHWDPSMEYSDRMDQLLNQLALDDSDESNLPGDQVNGDEAK